MTDGDLAQARRQSGNSAALPVRRFGASDYWKTGSTGVAARRPRGNSSQWDAISLTASACRADIGKTTLFPLLRLRVSPISAPALAGHVPFHPAKLVDHSRLLMTRYYTKSRRNAAATACVELGFQLVALGDDGLQDGRCPWACSTPIIIARHAGSLVREKCASGPCLQQRPAAHLHVVERTGANCSRASPSLPFIWQLAQQMMPRR
ncbi:hypothetical protein D9M68_482620 [compost metagenome]